MARKNKFHKIWIRKVLTKDGRTDEYKFLVDKSEIECICIHTRMYVHTLFVMFSSTVAYCNVLNLIL